ncbi:MAG TPA: alanine racemase, partial [Rhodospirillales bacterium]
MKPASVSDRSSLTGGRVTVDLGALVDNWRTMALAASGAETAAVLKADGYGVGLERAGTALAKAGCRTFFVALPDEGMRLRAIAPGAAIYVLDGLLPHATADYIAADLRPVLGSLPEVAEWAAAKRQGAPTGSAIHVDTDMNRLGLTLAEARDVAGDPALVTALAPSLVMSHLACADTPDHPMNARQLAAFREVRKLLPQTPASLANSAGSFLGPDYRFDMVRPGIALYGAKFIADRPPLKPVVALEARVLHVRDALPGETVGYGATQTVDAAARIAILAVGYADGYHRAASSSDGRSGARVFIRGRSAPLVGRVSMDLIAVDVTGIPEVARGDWAELFGPNVPVDEVAAHAGTI